MKVCDQAAWGAISPELKLPSAAVAVWVAVSLLSHVTVLLTPTTTVVVAGEKPGEFRFEEAPFSMMTCAPAGSV